MRRNKRVLTFVLDPSHDLKELMKYMSSMKALSNSTMIDGADLKNEEAWKELMSAVATTCYEYHTAEDRVEALKESNKRDAIAAAVGAHAMSKEYDDSDED